MSTMQNLGLITPTTTQNHPSRSAYRRGSSVSWQQDGQRIALICVRKALQLGGPERAGELTGRRMSWLGALWLSVSAWWWQMALFQGAAGVYKASA